MALCRATYISALKSLSMNTSIVLFWCFCCTCCTLITRPLIVVWLCFWITSLSCLIKSLSNCTCILNCILINTEKVAVTRNEHFALVITLSGSVLYWKPVYWIDPRSLYKLHYSKRASVVLYIRGFSNICAGPTILKRLKCDISDNVVFYEKGQKTSLYCFIKIHISKFFIWYFTWNIEFYQKNYIPTLWPCMDYSNLTNLEENCFKQSKIMSYVHIWNLLKNTMSTLK